MLRNAIVLSIVGLFGAANAYGGALSLDGSDDYVTLDAVGEGFPTGDDSYTIEVWFKADDDNNRNLFYMGDNDTRKANGIKLRGGSSNTLPENWNYGQDYHQDCGSDLTGAWHHFAAVYDSGGTGTGSRKLYLDGSQLGSGQTGLANLNVQDNDHMIGRVPGFGYYFDGLIDEFRIWDVARSASAISADWDRALLGTETGLVAYYQFTDLTDSVGSADGTAHNGASISSGDNAPLEPPTLHSDGGGNWHEADTWDAPPWVPAADIDIVVDGGDLVTVTGGADLGKSLSITGGGNVEVQINTGKTLTITNTVDVDKGGILDVDGTLIAGGLVSVAGILTGDGSVFADVNMKKEDTIHGILQPGSSVGTLDITGNLTLDDTSVYEWEVGDSAEDLDLVQVTGTLNLTNWALKIVGDGYTPPAGDYDLFTYTVDVGTFNQPGYYGPDPLPFGWTSDMLSVVDDDAGTVYLHVIPEPNTAALLVSGLLTLLLFARRRKR